MRFIQRLLKVWAAAALIAYGAAGIYRALRTDDLQTATLLFFIGAFLILAGVPLLPWLFAKPWYFARYWRL